MYRIKLCSMLRKSGCVSIILLIMMAAVIWAFTRTGYSLGIRDRGILHLLRKIPANIQ